MIVQSLISVLAASAVGAAAAAGDGELDPSFAGNGKAVVGFTNQSGDPVDVRAVAVAIQQDNKIVLVGFTDVDPSSSTTVIARLERDGSLDQTFANSGRAAAPKGLFGSSENRGLGVALQSDGKILVLGARYDDNAVTHGYVMRLTPDGTLDTGFGSGGAIFLPDDGTSLAGAAVTASGQIVATGARQVFVDDALFNVLLDEAGNVLSMQQFDTLNSAPAHRIILEDDSKAVFLAQVPQNNGCAVLRENVGATAFSLDEGFGTEGVTTFTWDLGEGPGGYCNAIDEQRDGKIVVAGTASSDSTTGTRATVLRLLPNGAVDDTFGRKAFTFVSGNAGMKNLATGVLVLDDQRIVVTGTADTDDPAHAPDDFAALRLNADGTLDETFTASTSGSSPGKVAFGFETSNFGRDDESFTSALQSSKVIMIGSRRTSDSAKTEQFAVARLQNDRIFADGFGP